RTERRGILSAPMGAISIPDLAPGSEDLKTPVAWPCPRSFWCRPRSPPSAPRPATEPAGSVHRGLAAQELDVPVGRGLEDFAGSGAQHRLPPAAVHPVEAVRAHGLDHGADRPFRQREPVRGAPYERDPVLARCHEDRVTGE